MIFQDFGVEIVADYMNGEELEYGGTVEVEADAEGRETAARQTEAEADYAEESSELTAMQVQHHRELNPRLNAIIITWNSLTTSKLQDVIQTPDIWNYRNEFEKCLVIFKLPNSLEFQVKIGIFNQRI